MFDTGGTKDERKDQKPFDPGELPNIVREDSDDLRHKRGRLRLPYFSCVISDSL